MKGILTSGHSRVFIEPDPPRRGHGDDQTP